MRSKKQPFQNPVSKYIRFESHSSQQGNERLYAEMRCCEALGFGVDYGKYRAYIQSHPKEAASRLKKLSKRKGNR